MRKLTLAGAYSGHVNLFVIYNYEHKEIFRINEGEEFTRPKAAQLDAAIQQLIAKPKKRK